MYKHVYCYIVLSVKTLKINVHHLAEWSIEEIMRYSHQRILCICFRKCFRAPDFHGVVLREKVKLLKICKISHFCKTATPKLIYVYVCMFEKYGRECSRH